jgi:hypothetical protein
VNKANRDLWKEERMDSKGEEIAAVMIAEGRDSGRSEDIGN